MRPGVFIVAIIIVAVILLTACTTPAEPESNAVSSLQTDFETSRLSIVADDGSEHQFDVYLATTFEQQRRGLMFVRQMPNDVGMLFVYPTSDIHSMWMKNTYISLDMIFARSNGSVSNVIYETEPLSLQSQASTEAVKYVLELNGGIARRLNIGSKSRLLVNDLEIAEPDD